MQRIVREERAERRRRLALRAFWVSATLSTYAITWLHYGMGY